MTAAIDLLPEASRTDVTPVFVTVDPARDTSQRMADHVKPLGHRIEAVRNIQRGSVYSVDHTSSVRLFGPNEREVERLPYEMDDHEVARRIAAHMAGAPPRTAAVG